MLKSIRKSSFFSDFSFNVFTVPKNYIALNQNGKPEGKHPELERGSYDIIENKAQSKPPVFIFIIETMRENWDSGLVHRLFSRIKDILKQIPKDHGHDRSMIKVGFIIRDEHSYYYNCPTRKFQRIMPIANYFFMEPIDSKIDVVIDAILYEAENLDNRQIEGQPFYRVMQDGLAPLQNYKGSGKLFIVQSTKPTDANMQNKNKFQRLGMDCGKIGCSVDLFIWENLDINLSSLLSIVNLTGGDVYRHTSSEDCVANITKSVSKSIGFDAQVKVRTSIEIESQQIYGLLCKFDDGTIKLASIASGTSFAIELHPKPTKELNSAENINIQISVEFTSLSGQRKIRILNLALKICRREVEFLKSCDVDAMVLFFAKQVSYFFS